MKAEKYIVTTTIHGKVRNQFWEPKRPLGLLYPEQYIVEKQGSVIRISDWKSKSRIAEFGPSDLDTGAVVAVQGMHIGIRRATSLSVPFLSSDNHNFKNNSAASLISMSDAQLFVYSGVRRSMISSQGVVSAFVAYARSRPIAVVYRKNEELYWIKPLLDGVRLKLRGEKSSTGSVGEPWQLSKDQLLGSTLIRGVYWWRFNLLNVPEVIPDKNDDKALVAGLFSNADQKLFRFFLIACGLFTSLILLALFQFYQSHPKEEKILPQFAKTLLKSPTIVPIKAKQLNSLTKPPVPIAIEKPKTVNVVDMQKDLVKPEQTPAKVIAKAEEKIAPALIAKKTSEVQGSKERGKNLKIAGAQKTETDDLKNLLGELTDSGGKAGLPGLDGATTQRSNARGLFSGGSRELLTPTEIRPGAPGVNDVKDNSLRIGGGNLGSNGSGDGIGYAAGEYAKIEGQGGSLISLDKTSYTVDEGLTKEEVAAVIESHMAEVRACYEASLLKKERLEGRVHYAFKIQPTGGVNQAIPNQVTFPDRDVIQCIQQRIQTWIFPKPRGGVTVNVNYPFVFRTLKR